MPTRKRSTAPTGTVSVTVVEPHLVYHDGEQRSGIVHNVAADVAAHWAKHEWVTINDELVENDPSTK